MVVRDPDAISSGVITSCFANILPGTTCGIFVPTTFWGIECELGLQNCEPIATESRGRRHSNAFRGTYEFPKKKTYVKI